MSNCSEVGDPVDFIRTFGGTAVNPSWVGSCGKEPLTLPLCLWELAGQGVGPGQPGPGLHGPRTLPHAAPSMGCPVQLCVCECVCFCV